MTFEVVSWGGANVQVILAEPNSAFVQEIDAIENRLSAHGISTEIMHSIIRLERAVKEAKDQGGTAFKVEYGHFSTHLRVSLVIIDDKYCHVVLNYPPKRTSESLGFFLERRQETEQGVVADLISHFDSVYKELNKAGRIKEIC